MMTKNNCKEEKLAKYEIGWWQAHHRQQSEKFIDDMSELYSLLFSMPKHTAESVVLYRVKAAKFHDMAENLEDKGFFEESNKYWLLAEAELVKHFKMLLSYIEEEKENT